MIYPGDFTYEAELRPRELSATVQRQPALPIEERVPALAVDYRRWLARLGDLLVAWGCALQTRYVVKGQTTACTG